MNNDEQVRMNAAVWFAVIGIIPGLATYVALTQYTFWSILLLLVLPILLLGVCGYFAGYAIPQEDSPQTGQQAILRGLMAGLASFVVFWLVLLVVAGARSPSTLTANPVLLLPLHYPLPFVLFLAAGIAAAWLLYAMRVMQGWLILIGAALIIPAVVVFLSGLPNPFHLPIYPDATDVQVGQFVPTDLGRTETRTTTFTVRDPADEVFAYYDRQLVREGWRPRLGSSTHSFDEPGRNYIVTIEQAGQPGQFELALWHSTVLQLP